MEERGGFNPAGLRFNSAGIHVDARLLRNVCLNDHGFAALS